LQLIDDIETREQLLKKASDLDIDIEDYIDDPVLIKQLIKEEEKLESNYKSNVLSYYYSTRGC
jgi:hypothetical protein